MAAEAVAAVSFLKKNLPLGNLFKRNYLKSIFQEFLAKILTSSTIFYYNLPKVYIVGKIKLVISLERKIRLLLYSIKGVYLY